MALATAERGRAAGMVGTVAVTAGPLHDIRIVAIEQYRRGPVGHDAAGRSRRPGHQGRRPVLRRRCLPLCAAVPGGRGLAVLRDLQPGQAEDLARPTPSRGARRCSKISFAASDAVFSNLRGDQPEQARSSLRGSRAVNPRIVCVSLSGFGSDGPRAREGGYDYTVQGLAGWMSMTGEPDGPPTKSGLSLVDFCGGYVAAHRDRLPASGAPGATAAAATPTFRSSRRRSRSSPTSGRGSPRGITSRCGSPTRHTSRSCPSRPSRPPTAGW